MIHIGIVWANPYSRNLGVGALAYSSLALLYDICEENGISADFTIIGSTGPSSDTININGKDITFRNVSGNDHLKWKSLMKLAVRPLKYGTRAILDLDVVFDISEGDSFTDIYGARRYEKMLNSKKFFNLLKTRQILMPQTIGPFVSPTNEKKAFDVMSKMDMVISRDKQSMDYTSQFLKKNKILEAIDIAFYLGYQRKLFSPDQIHVGLNVSALLWNGGYTRNNQFKLKCNYHSLIEEAIEYFINQPDLKLHLISHVISKRNSIEDDYTVAEHFHARYPQTVLGPLFECPIEAKSYISGLDFFVGSRMHACIAAFSSGVPVFPLAYSRKFNGLFHETLRYKWFGDCTNDNEGIILANLQRAFKEKIEIKNELSVIKSTIVDFRIKTLRDQLRKSIMNEQLVYAED